MGGEGPFRPGNSHLPACFPGGRPVSHPLAVLWSCIPWGMGRALPAPWFSHRPHTCSEGTRHSQQFHCLAL